MNPNFNEVRDDLVRHLQACGQVHNKIFWYEGTIPLLFEAIKFLDPKTVHKTFGEIMGVDADEV